MPDQNLSTAEIRKFNRNKVFSYIYSQKIVSKQSISEDLQMSMPTVTQNIKELENLGLIERDGYFESTGGRKAQMITCIEEAKFSIGVEILKDRFYIAAVNLFGEIFAETTHFISYQNADKYYRTLGEKINSFADTLPSTRKRLLGVGIAIQGLISADRDEVVWGMIMDNTGVNRTHFADYIKWPFVLIHDAEAAAFAEIWHQQNSDDSLYISLNRYLGSAIIFDDAIYQGKNSRSSTIEHMCLVEDGPLCYCGKKGCLETYCSVNALENKSGLALDQFFENMRSGDPEQVNLWNDYLSDLSLAINNSLSIVDTNIIIGGLLVPYLNKKDITVLTELVQQRHSFPLQNLKITLGQCGSDATKIGSALYYIESFLQQV